MHVDPSSLLPRLTAIRETLGRTSLEREGVITGLLTGLVAGHHVLLLGPPGTDKSRLIRSLCSHLTGARYFGRLLTKFTQPDELFGPLDVMRLERGEYRRITTGRLPEAEIVFLDEVFKGGSAILNTLLEIINERTWNDGTETRQVPLRMLVGASNELPNPEDGLEAFADRFPLRFKVDYLARDDTFTTMLHLPRDTKAGAPQPTMTLGEVDRLRELAEEVDVPPFIGQHLASLRKGLRTAGVVVSDRRWRQAISVLKAHALIRGKNAVEIADLSILIACLWNEPGQIGEVTKKIQQIPQYVTERLRLVGARVTASRSRVGASPGLKRDRSSPGCAMRLIESWRMLIQPRANPRGRKHGSFVRLSRTSYARWSRELPRPPLNQAVVRAALANLIKLR